MCPNSGCQTKPPHFRAFWPISQDLVFIFPTQFLPWNCEFKQVMKPLNGTEKYRKFFIGSRKKFGGGGISECDLTQSIEKMRILQISQRKCLSVVKLSTAFPLFHAAAYLWTSASSSTSIASSTIFLTNQRPGNRWQTDRHIERHTDILKYWSRALSESAGQKLYASITLTF